MMLRKDSHCIAEAKLAVLQNAPVVEGVMNKVEYVPNLYGNQMIFYHLTIDGKTQVGKVVYQNK
jgi:hypothetical protein